MRINILATFAYNAIPLPEKKSYQVSYTYLPVDHRKQPLLEAGARFSYVAESAVLNAALHDLDVEAAADSFVKNYDPTQSYKRGTIFFKDGDMSICTTESRPNRIHYRRLKDMRGKSPLPSPPYFSPKTLYDVMSKGDGTFFVPTAPSPQLVNGAIIAQNLSYMTMDYLDYPNVPSHKNDNFHIHVYSEKFLTSTTSTPEAFKFNFPKKLIFVNSTNAPVVVTKNLGECLPKNCIAYMEYNKTLLSFSRERLISFFANSRIKIKYSEHLTISQISNNQYLIRGIDEIRGGTPCVLDLQNEKVIVDNSSGIYINNQVLDNGAKVTTANSIAVISYVNTPSSVWLHLLAAQKSIIRIQVEENSYFFICKKDNLCDVIKFNSIFMDFNLYQENIPIPLTFNYYDLPNLIITVKNYGQFSNNCLYAWASINGNDKFNNNWPMNPKDWGVINMDGNGNFTISEYPFRLEEKVLIKECTVKKGDIIYIFSYQGINSIAGLSYFFSIQSYNLTTKTVDYLPPRSIEQNSYKYGNYTDIIQNFTNIETGYSSKTDSVSIIFFNPRQCKAFNVGNEKKFGNYSKDILLVQDLTPKPSGFWGLEKNISSSEVQSSSFYLSDFFYCTISFQLIPKTWIAYPKLASPMTRTYFFKTPTDELNLGSRSIILWE